MSASERPSEEIRVSTIELFFDLVFVFTITQLTSLLVAEPTARGVAQAVLIFGNLWWMYGGYVWLTNAVPPRDTAIRLLLLAGMGAFLVCALSVPDAFGDAGIAFGVGYLIVNVVHAGIFLKSSQGNVVRSVRRLGPTNVTTATVLLVAGFTTGWLLWTLWIAAFLLHWFTPFFTATSGFHIRAAHFVERHGLILLIALGESVVAVGLGVRHVDVHPGVLVTALLGLTLAAALWWLYFDGEDERAEHALTAAQGDRRTWLSLYAFGYAFLPILLGIVLVAAGVKLAVVHHGGEVTAASPWFLATGAAAYVGGLAWFRRLLRTGPITVRAALAAVCLATVAVGLAFSAEVQMGVLAAVLVFGVVADDRVLAQTTP
jgi:low temperature requirement protein LtrA